MKVEDGSCVVERLSGPYYYGVLSGWGYDGGSVPTMMCVGAL